MTPLHNLLLHSPFRPLSLAVAFTGTALAGSPANDAFTAADTDASQNLDNLEFAAVLPAGSSEKKVMKEFKKADLNGSLDVSLWEYLVYTREEPLPPKMELAFYKADESEDGTIDFWELAQAGKRNAAGVEHLKQFAIADTNQDLSIDLEEFTRYKQGRAVAPAGVSLLKFDLLDQNDDDSVSYAEFTWLYNGETRQLAMMRAFDKFDKNDNTWITRDEWNPGAPRSNP